MKKKKFKKELASVIARGDRYNIKKMEKFLILEMFKNHPEWTMSEKAKACGLSERTLYRRLTDY